MPNQHGFELMLGKVEAVAPEHKGALVDRVEVSADVVVLALGANCKLLPGIEHTVTVWGAPTDTVAVYEPWHGQCARCHICCLADVAC